MKHNHNEAWPFNLLSRIFDQEELIALKADPPMELEAFLIYTVRDMYPKIEAEMILQHFMEEMAPAQIAEMYNLSANHVIDVLAGAGERQRDPLLRETYRNGLTWRIEREKQTAYIEGFRKGYLHFLTDVKSDRAKLDPILADEFFNLPGHNRPIEFLELPEALTQILYYSRIRTIKQILDADEKQLLVEYKLEPNEIDDLAKFLKAKGYSCAITRARFTLDRGYYADPLLRMSLSETSACELNYFGPVDLQETFEFVLSLALNKTDKSILKLHYHNAIPFPDIAEQMGLSFSAVYERALLALRKLRDPQCLILLRNGLKTSVREMIRMESECGFQDGLNRAVIDWHYEDNNEPDHVPDFVMASLKTLPIEELDLCFKTAFRLRKNNVETIGDLVRAQDQDLLAIQSLGRTVLQQLRKKQLLFIATLRADMATDEISNILVKDTNTGLFGGAV